MRVIFFVVGTLFFALGANSQSKLVNNGSELFISNGSKIIIDGDLEITNSNGLIVPLNGTLELTGDIINSTTNTVFDPGLLDITLNERVLIFSGNQSQLISSDSLVVYGLTTNKTGGEVTLGGDIRVLDELKLLNGNILLNNKQIYFEYDPINFRYGVLQSESNTARIYDALNNSGKIWTERTGSISGGALIGTNFGIDINSASGTTSTTYTLERYHDKLGKDPLAGPGNGSIQRSFVITSSISNEPIDDIVINYFDGENTSALNENELGPWVSYDNISWLNKWNDATDSRNTSANLINSFKNDQLSNTQQITLAEINCAFPPAINFSSDTLYLCTGLTETLNPNAPGLIYSWSTGATTETIDVNAPGTYKLTVRNTAGSETLDSMVVVEKKLPVPSIGFSNNLSFVCNNTAFQFVNNTSTDPVDELPEVVYKWNFGDTNNPSAISMLENPSYQYINYGTYTVSLKATTEYGCTSTVTQTVNVHEIPQAGFTINDACTNEEIIVLDNTTYATDRQLAYRWVFSDLPNDTIASTGVPTGKQIASSGSYDLTLLVNPVSIACYDTLTKSFEVTPRPSTLISATDTVCVGASIGLINNSTISSGTILYHWEFSDGTSSSLKTPLKSFATGGNHTAILTASSGTGCSSTDTLQVHVIEIPTVSFSAINVCVGDTTQLDVLSPLGPGYTYEWNVPGYPLQYGPSIRNKMNVSGTQSIILNVLEDHGCTSTLTKSITVYPPPVPDFTFSDACVDADINLNNLSSISVGTLSYVWDFGDGTGSTVQNPLKSYATSGDYDITLTATSANGCSDEITQTVHINSTPTLNLGGTISTCGTSYVLDAGNAGLTYVWSDGSTGQSFTATSNGSYWAKVTSPAGCSVTDTVQVILQDEVIPDLGPDSSGCGSIELDAGYHGSSYLWSDGSTDRYLNVGTTGTYSVTVTDPNGCSGTDDVTITISPSAQVDLGSDIATCTNGVVTLDAGVGYTYLWNEGSTGQTLDVSQTGIYSVVVTNAQGCTATDEVYVEINSLPTIGLNDSYIACGELTLDGGDGFSSYLWSSGNTGRLETITTSQNISLQITNNNGCTSQKNIDITINAIPDLDLGQDVTACNGEQVVLDAGNTNVTYFWSTGETTQTINVQNLGEYSVRVTTSDGCTNEDVVLVDYEAPLILDWDTERIMCQQEGLTLDAGTTGYVYSWYYNNQPLIENTSEPTLFVTDEGEYRLEVSSGSCSAFNTVEVFSTTNSISADFLVSSIADVGDTVQFVQLSTPQPTWFEWQFGDGATSHEYHPDHVYFTPGDYQIILTISNGVCQDVLVKNITVNQLKEEKGKLVEDEPQFTEVLETDIYPNPTTTGLFTFSIELNKEVPIEVAVLDLSGRVLRTESFVASELEHQFDISDQQSGMYVIKAVIDGDIMLIRRIFKK